MMHRKLRIGTGVGYAVLVMTSILPGAGTQSAASAEPPDEKMDCRAYETKTSAFGFGVRFGTMLLPMLGPLSPSASAAPSVSYERKTGVAWDKTVHGLVARYVELCNRYNAGLVTKEEYQARMREIEGIQKDMAALESKVYDETRGHARSAQQDLDRALSKRPTAKSAETTPVADSLTALGLRIEQLETGGPAAR